MEFTVKHQFGAFKGLGYRIASFVGRAPLSGGSIASRGALAQGGRGTWVDSDVACREKRSRHL